jgi:hypothetical protein
MRVEAAEQAVNIGYRISMADMDRKTTMCEWTEGVHAFLSALAKEASWLEAIGLRAAAGVVTRVRRKMGCIQ